MHISKSALLFQGKYPKFENVWGYRKAVFLDILRLHILSHTEKNKSHYTYTVLKLSPNSCISGCYRDSTGKYSAGLKYYGASNPSLGDSLVSSILLDQTGVANRPRESLPSGSSLLDQDRVMNRKDNTTLPTKVP